MPAADPPASDASVPAATRWRLYESCVQSAADLVPVLRAIHRDGPASAAEPGAATVLGEDFCGSAALSRAWVAAVPDGRAIAVDHDADALAVARAGDDAGPGVASGRLRLVRGDVRTATDPAADAADIVHAGNFSVGELPDRATLLAWLRHAHARVASRGGIVACDLYGGESAFLLGTAERETPAPPEFGPDAEVRYEWEQRQADPLTGRVVDAVHFTVHRRGEILLEARDAFVYHWRLWGVPELRDTMLEAGFRTTECRLRVPDAMDDDGRVIVPRLPEAVDPDDPPSVDDSFDVLVVGRT